MAFITISKFLSMVSLIDQKNSRFNINDLYKSSLTVLSIKERERLALVRELFKNPEIQVSLKYNKFVKPVKSYRFVRESSGSSYHTDESCSRLNSDYENYEIPDEIKKRGDAECQRYISWFLSHEYLLAEIGGHEKFIFARNSLFDLKDKDIGEVHENNSGVTYVENINLESLERDIDNLLEKAKAFKRAPLNVDVMIDYADESKTTGLNDKSQAILNEWDGIKSAIKGKMITYLMVKFNPKLSFSKTLLEQIGFKKCSFCAEKTFGDMDDDLPF